MGIRALSLTVAYLIHMGKTHILATWQLGNNTGEQQQLEPSSHSIARGVRERVQSAPPFKDRRPAAAAHAALAGLASPLGDASKVGETT